MYHYGLREVETAEPFSDRRSFYLLELPRGMRYTDEYDIPVAAWCRIFRIFRNFAISAVVGSLWWSGSGQGQLSLMIEPATMLATRARRRPTLPSS